MGRANPQAKAPTGLVEWLGVCFGVAFEHQPQLYGEHSLSCSETHLSRLRSRLINSSAKYLPIDSIEYAFARGAHAGSFNPKL